MKTKYNEIEARDNMKIKNEVETQSKVRPKMERIIKTPPVKHKPGIVSRLTVGLLGPEGFKGAAKQVRDDIIGPSIKKLAYDALNTGLYILFFKGEGPPSHNGVGYGRVTSKPRTDYTKRYQTPSTSPTSVRSIQRTKMAQEFEIKDRENAISVLYTLKEYADNYNDVPVAIYYDLIGYESSHTDWDYGWTIDTIIKATIVPIAGGWTIKFPPMEVI